MADIFNLKENKVTTNLSSYPLCILGETGLGKTYSLNLITRALSDGNKKPLFLMFESRFQHIPGIMAVRINSIPELEAIKSQLRSPKAKELYSCIIVDTADSMDTMMENFIASSKEVEISQDLSFGKGNKYIKSKLFFIDELRNNGWVVHFAVQAIKNTNIMTQETTYDIKLNKETWSKISQAAYLIGMITKDAKSEERLLTFKKTNMYPLLKDSVGMPNVVKVTDFKQVLEKAILSIPGADFTTEDTINPVVENSDNFKDLVDRGNELGGILANAGKLDEALNVLKTNIGQDDNGNPKTFDSLIETQIDLAKLCVMKLEDLVTKYKLQ